MYYLLIILVCLRWGTVDTSPYTRCVKCGVGGSAGGVGGICDLIFLLFQCRIRVLDSFGTEPLCKSFTTDINLNIVNGWF